MDNANRILGSPESIRVVDHTRLARIALRQNGLFTRTQAHTCGVTLFQIRTRVGTGEWREWNSRVLSLAGTVQTPERRDRAAQLATPNSVLAGGSAARLWDMKVPLPGTRLIVPRRPSSWSLPDVDLECATLPRRDIKTIDGAPVTSLERTLFDCLRLLAAGPGASLLDQALQRGWATIDSLADRLHHATGRRGVGRVVKLVHEAATGTRSDGERRLARLLRQAGIRGWEFNRPILGPAGLIALGDVVFEAERLVLEVDGWAFHSADGAFQRDRTRQNRLVNAGWTVLRFTWHDLVHRPTEVIRTIRTALARLAGP